MGENMLTVLRAMLEVARFKGQNLKPLQTVIGDLQRINKDFVSKDQMLAYVKAQIKSVEKTVAQAQKLGQHYEPDHDFLTLLADLEHEYTPPQLTESQLRSYFADLILTNPSMNKGMLMKALKEEFEGFYDGKFAAQIAGEFHHSS